MGQAKGLAAPEPLRLTWGNHRARHEYVIAIHAYFFMRRDFPPIPLRQQGRTGATLFASAQPSFFLLLFD